MSGQRIAWRYGIHLEIVLIVGAQVDFTGAKVDDQPALLLLQLRFRRVRLVA